MLWTNIPNIADEYPQCWEQFLNAVFLLFIHAVFNLFLLF